MIKKAVYLERSPAKINLYLDILGKREDGYHNIETVFQAVNLEDHLTFEISVDCAENEDDISDSIDFEIEIDSNNEQVKSLGLDNSVTKAIEAYFGVVPEEAQVQFNPANPYGVGILDMISTVKIDVFIDKNIPLEAGLAGGSANAAATLRVLNKFFEDNFHWSLSKKELLKLAADIGSDVPFCLQALEMPRCFGESRGEKLSAIEDIADRKNFLLEMFDEHNQLIIVKPNFGIATADAYALFSKVYGNKKIERTGPGEGLGFFNRFESLIFDEYPELLNIQDTLLEIGCNYVLLSGSGSAILGLVNQDINLEEVYKAAEESLADCEIFRANFL